jgi:hypothetical protein
MGGVVTYRGARLFLCTLGLILALYAVHVEHKVESIEHKKAEIEKSKAAALSMASDTPANDPFNPSFLIDENPEDYVAFCDIESIGASCRCVWLRQ